MFSDLTHIRWRFLRNLFELASGACSKDSQAKLARIGGDAYGISLNSQAKPARSGKRRIWHSELILKRY